jgi:hypothetical protein
MTEHFSAPRLRPIVRGSVRLVAVRKHPVGAKAGERPGDDTLTGFVLSSPGRARRTRARTGGR